VCSPSCLEFGARALRPEEVRGRAVLEVGARDVNGSLRPRLEALGPASYLGIDVEHGPGVDVLCDAAAAADRFGEARFDLVVGTELLEHVRDWRGAVAAMKRTLRPGGALLLTTRSRGFRYHGYPRDFWRFEPEDLRAIFADFEIEALERDPAAPGVFLKAQKRGGGAAVDLAPIALYSIVLRRRALDVDDRALRRFLRWYPLRRRLFGPVR
jgi:SAM-dependent methyltransferase